MIGVFYEVDFVGVDHQYRKILLLFEKVEISLADFFKVFGFNILFEFASAFADVAQQIFHIQVEIDIQIRFWKFVVNDLEKLLVVITSYSIHYTKLYDYHTDEMVLSSVGNISFEQFMYLAEKYFGSMTAKPRTWQREVFSNYTPGFSRLKKDTFQSHCVMGNIAYHANDQRRMGMVLLNNVLGGQSMNSRLNLSLRERHGMAYNVESNYTAFSDTGQFNVYFGTDRENLERAIGLVHKEFRLLKEKKLGSLQLSKAKKQLIGQIAISSENRDDLMLALGKSFLLYNKVDSLPEIYEKIQCITSELLLEIANEILDESSLSTLIYE